MGQSKRAELVLSGAALKTRYRMKRLPGDKMAQKRWFDTYVVGSRASAALSLRSLTAGLLTPTRTHVLAS